MRLIFVLALIVFGVESSYQLSTPSSMTYQAAVAEFSYEKGVNMTSAQILSSNLAKYSEIMANSPEVDIIVFPEMTLNGMLTAVEISSSATPPCDDSAIAASDLTKQISCSAKNFNRYVVVNIVTKARCPDTEMIENQDPRNCTLRPDGFSYYNTNVVFDRSGKIISVYRKFNLFGESVDKPFKPAMVTFDTDFGVKFGHFICFDLMFRLPALELIRNGVTDIIFTTMWFSEMPFLTAVQVQQNWAYSNNANLIASGANNPAVGSTGSGIYAGRKGPIASIMEGKDNTHLLIATIPKRIQGNENFEVSLSASRFTKHDMKPLKLKRDQLDRYNIQFLTSPEVGIHYNISTRSCHNDQCCNFNLQYRLGVKHENRYEYATAVYHGNRTFDGFADGGIVACAIIACQTRNISTCGVRNEELENNFEWLDIEISGDFPNEDGQFFYLPTSLDTSILPLTPKEFTYEASISSNHLNVSDDRLHIRMKFDGFHNQIQRDLLAFGIYGRDYNLDVVAGDAGIGAASKLFVVLSVILTVTIRIVPF